MLIAVVGPRWMELLKSKSAGDRDYVCEEGAAALQHKIIVVPVRVGARGTTGACCLDLASCPPHGITMLAITPTTAKIARILPL